MLTAAVSEIEPVSLPSVSVNVVGATMVNVVEPLALTCPMPLIDACECGTC